jgi:hypothetical protein
MASVATGPGRARSGDGMVARVLGSLPRGGSLSDEVWAQRHRGVTLLLWAHVPAIVLFAQIMGDGAPHGLLESLPVVALAVAASQQWLSRIARTTAAAFGLLTCSAILVHLSGGYIEAHFHFFVMVAVVVLYQEWAPFLASVAYVVLHHGVAGALAPDSVFNHPAGQHHPAQWALIHGAFILAICCAGIAAWRLNETLRSVAVEGEQQLLEAQRVAHLGSWAWDIDNDVVTWSDELTGSSARHRATSRPRSPGSCPAWTSETTTPPPPRWPPAWPRETRSSSTSGWPGAGTRRAGSTAAAR